MSDKLSLSKSGKPSKKELEYQEYLHRLWALIQKSSPDKIKEILDSLNSKTLRDLRVYNNPYKKPVFISDKNKVLAFSVINISEKYAQRFAMTSLIGFIYRMLDEYKADDNKFTSEDDPIFAMPYNQYVKQYKRQKPEENLTKQFEEIRAKLELLRAEGKLDEAREVARESYIVRVKLIKYRVFWLREDLTVYKERLERLTRDMRLCTDHRADNAREIATLEKKLETKREHDKARTNIVGRRNKSEMTAEEISSALAVPKGMTVEEINRKIADYEMQIKIKRDNIERDLEKEAKLAVEISQIEASIKLIEDRLALLGNKFKEVKVEYLQRTGYFKDANPGTSKHKRQLVSCDKKSTPLDDIEVEQYSMNQQEYDEIADRVKKELGIEKTAEDCNEEIAQIIQKFLDFHFRYNPDNHVRCAYKPNYEDKQRKPITAEDREKAFDAGEYEKCIMPPDDVFYRWNRYTENNYEPLRQACDDIYSEKSDFENAIVPLEVFEAKTPEKTMEAFDLFKRKYQDEFDAEVFAASFGKWNLLAPWEQNREVRDFYTENTEIIKRIVDQHKDDQRIGMKLMKDRSKKGKKTTPKDDNAISQYRKSELKPNSDLERHGAQHASEITVEEFVPTEIKPSDVPRDTDESTSKEIEVGVHVIKPAAGSRRRRIRGESDQWKFHIPSEPLMGNNINVMDPREFQMKNKDVLNL